MARKEEVRAVVLLHELLARLLPIESRQPRILFGEVLLPGMDYQMPKTAEQLREGKFLRKDKPCMRSINLLEIFDELKRVSTVEVKKAALFSGGKDELLFIR